MLILMVVSFGLMMTLAAQVDSQENLKRIDITVLNSPENQCPSSEESEDARETISQKVRAALLSISHCGDQRYGWRPIAFHNMTDPSHDCPSGLDITSRTTSKRLCEPNHGGTCSSTILSTAGLYSQVCGRIIGYQVGSTSAFGGGSRMEGVSLTYGNRASHIWTFAAGINGLASGVYSSQKCPCDTQGATAPPAFVGNDYFCESGRHSSGFQYNEVYLNDPLWDGKNCMSTSTCCQLNNPPWFTKNLTNPTADDIEMRVCSNQWHQETILLELIELYVK